MNRPKRLRFLITAGPTREYLDPVRYLSNESSGRMGFALAEVAAGRGHRVCLVHGPVALQRPERVRAIRITSAAELLAACLREWPGHDALIMTAAVADYAPARPRRAKLKKSADALRIELRPTVDVLAALTAGRRADQLAVGFALEDRNPRRNAGAKLRRKNLDAIVLNPPETMSGSASAAQVLVHGQDWLTLPRMSKKRLAGRLVRLVERLARQNDAD